MGSRATIVLALLAACSPEWKGEADIHGMHLVVESERADFQDTPEFRRLVHDVASAGALAWAHSPSELKGWRLRIKDGDVWCGGGHGHGGCTDPGNRTITVSTTFAPDFAHSVFAHEMMHVFLAGDVHHDAHEWWECEAWEALWFWANGETHLVNDYDGAWVGTGWDGIPYCAAEPVPIR